jgi:hypothetical protein
MAKQVMEGRMNKVALLAVVIAASVTNAHADDATYTQIGSWSCSAKPCDRVRFHEPFGGTPTVVTVQCGYEGGKPNLNYLCRDSAQAPPSDVKPDGFSPPTWFGTGPGWGGIYVAIGPRLVPGIVTPNYIVLTVVYAPPGTNNGNSRSNVQYAAGSTTGTKTTASQTFKFANTLSFNGEGGFLGNDTGGGTSFSFSRSTTDTQSLDIQKTTNSKIDVPGPGHDGIDHNEDEIWILLKPDVDLALSSSPPAQWMLSNDNLNKHVQWLEVGQLNGNPNYSIAPGLAAELLSAGITPAEYSNIVKHDPLACQNWVQCGSSPNISPSTDPNRFNLISCQIAYEPPGSSAGSASPVQTWQQTNSSTSTTSQKVVDEYSVGLSMTQTGDYLDFVKAELKDAATWTWTNSTENATTTGTTESAAFSIGGPAFGYKGPTALCVYFDALYKSFAFDLVPPQTLQLAVQGTLTNAAGNLEPYKEVALVDKGMKQITFTNEKGEYRFYGPISGPASIETVEIPSRPVPGLHQTATVDLQRGH